MYYHPTLNLDVRPLTDAVGAETRGVDVSGNPDDTTIDAIRTAFSRHGVRRLSHSRARSPGTRSPNASSTGTAGARATS